MGEKKNPQLNNVPCKLLSLNGSVMTEHLSGIRLGIFNKELIANTCGELAASSKVLLHI